GRRRTGGGGGDRAGVRRARRELPRLGDRNARAGGDRAADGTHCADGDAAGRAAMSAWWGKEATPLERRQLALGDGPLGPQPVLVPSEHARIAEAVRARIVAFTPTWRRRGPLDAGEALVRLFSDQAEAVALRLDR